MMGWICKVCHKPAKYIFDFGTSHLDKKGFYRCQKLGYCEEHKPILQQIEENGNE